MFILFFLHDDKWLDDVWMLGMKCLNVSVVLVMYDEDVWWFEMENKGVELKKSWLLEF